MRAVSYPYQPLSVMAAALILAVGLASTAAGQQPTITWLGAYPNPVAQGDQVTIITSVMTEGAWPLGTVSFWDDSLLVQETGFDEGGSCGILVNPGGTGSRYCSRRASLTISTLTAGIHPLTSSYSGDVNTSPSVSDPVLLTVQQPPEQVPALCPAAALTLALLITAGGCVVLRRNRRRLEAP